MTGRVIPWLPSDGFYLDKAPAPHVRPYRPWTQGDVFSRVPIYVAMRKAGEPKAKLTQGPVLLLGHTCSLRAGTRLAVLQNVCRVRQAKEQEQERLNAAETSYTQLFPLPDLFDGGLWVADFNFLGTAFHEHLADKRVACLGHVGLAALQRRYAYHAMRVDQPLDDRIQDIRGTWNEVSLWEEWCTEGHGEADFQTWLDQPLEQGPYAGTVRRKAVEFAPDQVRTDFPEDAHLSSPAD